MYPSLAVPYGSGCHQQLVYTHSSPMIPETHSSCITPNHRTSKQLQLAATATASSKN